jgi:hypothetical protein
LKITKHQEYLFCDTVSLTDQRNVRRIIKISSSRVAFEYNLFLKVALKAEKIIFVWNTDLVLK